MNFIPPFLTFNAPRVHASHPTKDRFNSCLDGICDYPREKFTFPKESEKLLESFIHIAIEKTSGKWETYRFIWKDLEACKSGDDLKEVLGKTDFSLVKNFEIIYLHPSIGGGDVLFCHEKRNNSYCTTGGSGIDMERMSESIQCLKYPLDFKDIFDEKSQTFIACDPRSQ